MPSDDFQCEHKTNLGRIQRPLLSWPAYQVCSCASGIKHQWGGSKSSRSSPGLRSVSQTTSSRRFRWHEDNNKPATGRNCTLFLHLHVRTAKESDSNRSIQVLSTLKFPRASLVQIIWHILPSCTPKDCTPGKRDLRTTQRWRYFVVILQTSRYVMRFIVVL